MDGLPAISTGMVEPSHGWQVRYFADAVIDQSCSGCEYITTLHSPHPLA